MVFKGPEEVLCTKVFENCPCFWYPPSKHLDSYPFTRSMEMTSTNSVKLTLTRIFYQKNVLLSLEQLNWYFFCKICCVCTYALVYFWRLSPESFKIIPLINVVHTNNCSHVPFWYLLRWHLELAEYFCD